MYGMMGNSEIDITPPFPPGMKTALDTRGAVLGFWVWWREVL